MSNRYKRTIKITLHADSEEQMDSYLAAISARYDLTKFFSSIMWAYNYGVLSSDITDNIVKLWSDTSTKGVSPILSRDVDYDYGDINEILHQQDDSDIDENEVRDILRDLYKNSRI